MEWKKPSPELGKILEAAMTGFGCRKKTMFGAPVYVVNGNMFAGVHEDHIFLRLSEPDRKKLIETQKGAAPFEPMKGRVMKEYMVLPPELYKNPGLLQQWLQRSYDYARKLVPKAPKRSARKS